MAQWDEIKLHISNHAGRDLEIIQYYDRVEFPLEVRESCAAWLENESNWSLEDHEPMRDDALLSLYNEMAKGHAVPSLAVGQTYRKLKSKYPTNETLAKVITELLKWERSFINQYGEDQFPDKRTIKKALDSCKILLSQLQSQLEDVVYPHLSRGDDVSHPLAQLIGPPTADADVPIIHTVWGELKHVLETWQRCQQLHFITEEELMCLDPIQEVFQEFATLLQRCAALLHNMPALCDEAKQLLEEVIMKSFIIEEQTPQNLKNISSSKKGIQFELLVRFLVGHVLAANAKPTVHVSFHCEYNLADLTRTALHKHGNVLVHDKNITSKPLVHTHDQWCADFRKDLKIIGFHKCDHKKTVEDVSERKYGFLVKSDIKVPALGKNKTIHLEAISLPVIITTQTSQDWSAKATLLWDCAFAAPDRTCYEVPETVPWCGLGMVLSKRFAATTGRGLTLEQQNCLAKKLRGKKLGNYSNEKISWKAFNKNKLAKDFTFWKWFYAVNNLVMKHLRKPWQEGLIHGFIDKAEVRQKLSDDSLQSGTFILRFSEKNIEDTQSSHFGGGLCVAYMEKHEDEDPRVEFVYPFMANEFESTPFCKYLQTLEVEDDVNVNVTSYKKSPLNFLYPNRQFDETFRACILEENAKNTTQEMETEEEDDDIEYRKPMKKLTIQRRPGDHSVPASPAGQSPRVLPPDDELIQLIASTTASLMQNMPSATTTSLQGSFNQLGFQPVENMFQGSSGDSFSDIPTAGGSGGSGELFRQLVPDMEQFILAQHMDITTTEKPDPL